MTLNLPTVATKCLSCLPFSVTWMHIEAQSRHVRQHWKIQAAHKGIQLSKLIQSLERDDNEVESTFNT